MILKGFWAVLVPPLQYLPGRRRKKEATQVRLLIVMFLVVVTWATVSKNWIMMTGRGHAMVGR